VSRSALRVASVRLFSPSGGLAGKLECIARSAAQAAVAGVKLLVFPELCLTDLPRGRSFHRRQADALAEPFDGPSIDEIAHTVEHTGVAIGVGFIERAGDGRLFNSYVVCLPGGARHCHRQLHVCDEKPFHEGASFTTFDTPWGVRVAILIGADIDLVENARATALLGSTLLIAPHRAGRDVRLLQSRARDNGMFVIGCNGFDEDEKKGQTAATMIADPYGDVVPPNEATDDEPVIADLDVSRIAKSAGQRALKTRRPELYDVLAQTQTDEPSARHAGFSSKRSVAVSFAVVTRRRALPAW
jgi:predicted amidohydrolase